MKKTLNGRTVTSLVDRPVTRGGARRTKPPLENFSPPLEKYVGHSLKVLDIV